MTVEELNREFKTDAISFNSGPGGLITAKIENSFATAEISLMGAHILNFRPANAEPVLWMSPASSFAEGKPIRGGIPVCFPWFADHPDDKSKPLHGFVRTRYWSVTSARERSDGNSEITMTISDDADTQLVWPYSFRCTIAFTIGRELSVELIIENTDTQTITFTDALHSYLFTGSSSDLSITGLGGIEYLDKTDRYKRKMQEGDIRISRETNRIYCSTSSDIEIHDPVLSRIIRVRKSGSGTTVVWNPWLKAMGMADMTAVAYQNMICVEAVNYGEDKVELEAGKTHTVATTISLE